jgi:Cu(I)/Ag(I) efflux system membrane fusion protein
MNRKHTLVIAVLLVAALGAAAIGAWYALSEKKSQGAATATEGAKKERKILYWTDPMIPGFKSDKPGKSPMNMDMVPVYDDAQGSTSVAGGGTPGATGGPTDGTPIVTVRPEIVQNLGVRTHTVTRGAPPRRMVTTGYLFRDDQGMAVLVDVFDRDVNLVRPGQQAEVRVSDVPGRVFPGAVDRVESDIDIGPRSLKARVRLNRPDATLKPNMLAEVVIQGAPAGRRSLFIPREALIRTGQRNAVVLRLSEGRFQSVEVVPGVESDDWVEILKGIKEGDTVVTSGQFLIDSEANVRASFSRMQPAEGEEKKP